MLVQGLVNSFGAVAAAAFAAGNKVESFLMMPLINIGNATSTYVAQNTGAGEMGRVKEGFKKVTIINVLITMAISAFPLLMPETLMQHNRYSQPVCLLHNRSDSRRLIRSDNQ